MSLRSKWSRLCKIVKFNGGIFKSLRKLWFTDQLKEGCFVGCDSYGNKYYCNPRYFIGASRWVEYNERFLLEYDASQVTPEWFGWLHYKTDCLPYCDPVKVFINQYCPYQLWLQPHIENLSGTRCAYYPYSTTTPKISTWDGCSYCAISYPTQPMPPCPPMQPTKPTQPLKPIQPDKSTQPMQPCQPIEPCPPMKPCPPMQPCQPTQPTQPVKPIQPVQPTQQMQPFQPIQPCQLTQPIQPTQPVKPIKPTQPIKPIKPKPPKKN